MSNQLQHKLQQFEAVPPNEIWLAIEEALNEPASTIQDKLLHFEAPPPSNTWERIEASLSTSNSKTISIVNRPWLRYAAAAILLGIVSLGIYIFAIDQPKQTLAQQPSNKGAQNSSITAGQTTVNSTTTLGRNQEAINSNTQNTEITSANGSSSSITPANDKRYKVVAKEDGKMVRLSQKALAVFDCAIKSTANNSVRCKENIQNMQEKMATSVISPAGDFAGLIDMIKTLEENK